MVENFMQRLKVKIKEEGYSIRNFEALCGISNGTISRAIKNNKQFQIEVLLKIATKFPDWNMHELVHGQRVIVDVKKSKKSEKMLMTHKELLRRMIELGENAKQLAEKNDK